MDEQIKRTPPRKSRDLGAFWLALLVAGFCGLVLAQLTVLGDSVGADIAEMGVLLLAYFHVRRLMAADRRLGLLDASRLHAEVFAARVFFWCAAAILWELAVRAVRETLGLAAFGYSWQFWATMRSIGSIPALVVGAQSIVGMTQWLRERRARRASAPD
jgi:hypothetical protein